MMDTPAYRLSLTKDEINELPITCYDGTIFVVDCDEKLDEALDALKDDTLLGLDTEMRPTFGRGKPLHPTALLQLCGSHAAVLIRVQQVPVAGRIKELLENPNVLKVGVAIGDDMRLLRRTAEFSAAGLVDLAQTAKKAGIQTLGLRSLAANFLGKRISKGAQCSNWENPELTPQQIAYAATDAWIGREIYLKMQEHKELVLLEEKTKIQSNNTLTKRYSYKLELE
jgi:ribonuclease D